ncbi:MAG: HAD family hydrolase [Candidatus Bathyarchaeia archaeon]
MLDESKFFNKKKAVLFDLGNTLAFYFERNEFPAILRQAITQVQSYLDSKGMLNISPSEMWRRVQKEDYESDNHKVRPLEERLIRIFQLNHSTLPSNMVMTMCRHFMKPIFARSHLYLDTLPTLKELKSRGLKTAIVSNTTWGSPANLWREEIERLSLSPYMDAVVFCRDVGWRKPAKQIFEYALKKLNALAQECVFVGDDPRWDLIGPQAVGMSSIIIDRKGLIQHVEKAPIIKSLEELCQKLG